MRSVIFVSLRMAASAVTPLSPMPLSAILRARGRMGNGERVPVGVSMSADTQASTRGRGALEIGDLCLLEDSSERGGALDSDVIVRETARGGWEQACVNGR